MTTKRIHRPALTVAAIALTLAGGIAGAAPAAAAGLLRTLDWESAQQQTVPSKPPQGWAAEYHTKLVHPDTGEPQLRVSRPPEPVRSGNAAARFELHKNDPPIRNGSRAELSATPLDPKGAERWYGFSVYLPPEWTFDRSAEIVTQWHQHWDIGSSPPLALVTRKGNWEISQNWEGYQHQTIVGAYQTGRWTDWVFHVKWSSGSDGLVQIWRDGQPVSGFVNRVGKNTYNDPVYSTYMKIGIYKWDWSQGKPSDTTRRVMYHDELRVADAAGTYATVAPGGFPANCTTGAALPVSAATANTWEPINPPAQAIDGNLATRWSGQGFGTYLQLDLGSVHPLCAARVAWHRGELRWNDFTVYVSSDGTTYTKVWEGRSSGTAAGFETYHFASPRDGRYVRIAFWQNPENDWASISEAQVLGLP